MPTSLRATEPRTHRPPVTGSIIRRLPAVLITALLATAVTVARADATSPTSTEASFHLNIPHFIRCGGFGVTLDGDVIRRVTTFTDESGTPTRVVTHIRFEGALTNPETGKSVLDNGSFKRTLDLSDGSITVSGGFRVVHRVDLLGDADRAGWVGHGGADRGLYLSVVRRDCRRL